QQPEERRKPGRLRQVDTFRHRSDTASVPQRGDRSQQGMSANRSEIELNGGLIDAAPRTDWTLDEVHALFDMPLFDLLYAAQSVHRRHFDPNAVQVSTLLSIKTGACP